LTLDATSGALARIEFTYKYGIGDEPGGLHITDGKKHIKVAVEGKEDTVERDLIVKKAVTTGETQWIFTAKTR